MILKEKINDYREKTGKTLPQIADAAKVSLKNLYEWSRGIETDITDECKRLISYIDGIEQVPCDDTIPNQVQNKEKSKLVPPLASKKNGFQRRSEKSETVYPIGKRLQEAIERYNIKVPDIAAATGLSRHSLYKWQKGTTPSNINDFLTLKSFLDRLENKNDEDVFLFESQKPATLRLPLNTDREPIPQVSGKAAAGTIVITDDEPELIVDRISAPCLGNMEGIVEVAGESMNPTYQNGCRIVIMRLKEPRRLNWGECYFIIDNNWQGTVRRIYPSDINDSIKLVSDNPNQEKYPAYQLQWSEIRGIFKVVAAILKG